MSEPERRPAILLEEGTGDTPDPGATSPSLEEIQAENARLQAERDSFEQQARDNRAHSDAQVAELRTAHEMLRDAYSRGNSDSAPAEFVEPEAPTTEQLVNDPSLSAKYAREYARSYGDHVRKSTVGEVAPFLQWGALTQPVINQIYRSSAESAFNQARGTLDEDDAAEFDQMAGEISKVFAGSPTGTVQKLDPNSWVTAFDDLRRRRGRKPVRQKSPAPVQLGPSQRRDTTPADPTPTRIPGHILEMAKRLNRDPKELYKRHLERTGGK